MWLARILIMEIIFHRLCTQWKFYWITNNFLTFVYHQYFSVKCDWPNLSSNRTVYTSRLKLDSVIGQLKGQLTHLACVSGQSVSCAGTVVSHFAELTVVLWKHKINVWFPSKLLAKFWLIDNRTSCHPIISLIILVINKADSHFVVVSIR